MSADDLDLRIHRWFERSLSPEEEDRLWTLLRDDPRAADRFVELAELESGLVESLQAHAEAPAGVRLPGRTSRRSLRPSRSWAPFLAAAGLLVAALALAVFSVSKPRPRETARRPAPQSVPAPLPEPPRVPAPPEEPKKQESALPEIRRPVEPLPPRVEPEPKKESARVEKLPDLPAPPVPLTVPEAKPVATLDRLEGPATADGAPLKPGDGVKAGAALETGRGGLAVLRFEDGTTVECGPETSVRELRIVGGKGIHLLKGSLAAAVTRQFVPMVLTTPHAEVRVLGTRLTLAVAETTRVEVQEGRVRVRRLPDGASADVGAGQFAVAAKGTPLAAKPVVLVASFQDGAGGYAGTRDTSISMREPAANFGAREGLFVHRANDNQHAVLLKWDLSMIPPGSRVVSAEVTLFVTGGLDAPGYRAYEARRPWQESEATWRVFAGGRPWQTPGAQADADRGSRPLGVLAPSATGLYTFPLSEAAVQAWVNAPPANHGIVIAGTALQNAWEFNSRESSPAERRPKLTVSYLPAR